MTRTVGNGSPMTDRRCEHGGVWPHWIGDAWPPLVCGGSPSNWFVYGDAYQRNARRLHRFDCKVNPAAMLGYDGGPLLLATPAELWAVPVGYCCRVDKAQRYAVTDAS